MLGKLSEARVLRNGDAFESFQHALTGKYGYVDVSRYGGIQMPEIADVGEYR
ncbi:MAG: hypothetical protein ACLU30_19830 [Odoribacter splanchnicus]